MAYTLEMGGYIDYEKDEFPPEESWKHSASSVLRNAKKHFPQVKHVSKFCDHDGVGLRFICDDLDVLKHLWVFLSYAAGEDEYKKLLNDGLEHDLSSTGFYDSVTQA